MSEGTCPMGEDEPLLDAASGMDAVACNRWMITAAAAIAVLAVLVRFWVSHRTHALGEDALITLRYAENIASGRGWVYNPGEHVLGTTTPLFTLLLACAAWLRLPAMTTGVVIDILADGITCYLIARLLARREIGYPVAGLFAAALYALSSTPISISISGMETALVTCAGMAAIHAYVAGRPRLLCGCGALLFLLRIDGLLLFGLLLAGHVLRSGRVPWRGLALFLLMLLPWIAFATLYFGSPVPASVVAKLTVYSHTAWTPGSFTNTIAFNHEAFRSQFLLGWPQRIVTTLFVVGAFVIIAAMRRSRFSVFGLRSWKSAGPKRTLNKGILFVPVLWVLFYYGTMLVSHVPAFPWYFLPPWPLVVSAAMLGVSAGLQAALALLARRTGLVVRAGRMWWAACLILFAVMGLAHIRSIEGDISAAQMREDTLRRPLGLWLREHVASGERVLMEPIGYAGYYSGRRILDMVGLVSPEVLPYYHTGNALSGIVSGLRPEWLCLRSSERDLLHQQDTSLPDREYALVQAFPSAADPAFYLYHRRSALPR